MKLIRTILCFFLVLGLIACSKEQQEKDKNVATDTNNVTTDTNNVTADTSDAKRDNTDKNGDEVEVTFPAAMFKNISTDAINEKAKKEGIREVIKNNDGSVTYKMSKSAYNDLLKESEKTVNNLVERAKNNIKSIHEITHNKNFSKFTLVVDRKKYENSSDGFATYLIGISALNYQLFKGTHVENAKVSISLKDKKSGNVFSVMEFPDILEKLNKK